MTQCILMLIALNFFQQHQQGFLYLIILFLIHLLRSSYFFWDTCPKIIGQDFHIIQKTYCKTNGKMYTKPIYVPFNQVSIKTDGTFWDDCKARFWQAQNHAQGVESLAYTLKMFVGSNFKWRNLAMIYNVSEACLLSSLIPWVFLAMIFQSNILVIYMNSSQQSSMITFIDNIVQCLSNNRSFIYLKSSKRIKQFYLSSKKQKHFKSVRVFYFSKYCYNYNWSSRSGC